MDRQVDMDARFTHLIEDLIVGSFHVCVWRETHLIPSYVCVERDTHLIAGSFLCVCRERDEEKGRCGQSPCFDLCA